MPRPHYAPSPDEEHKPLSVLLRELTEVRGPVMLPLDEVVDHFGRRAFGALLFIFAVPNLLPLPPGSTTVLGAPLVLIAPQLMFATQTLWVPRVLGQRAVRRTDLKKVFGKVLPRLTKIEKLLAPRLDWVFGPVGDRLIGLICTVLALVLILPIPFGNVLPALTIATLSLGLTQRDGLVALIGYALAAASFAVLALSVGTVIAAVQALIRMFGI